MPRINRGMVNLGACLIAGIRLARESMSRPTAPSRTGENYSISTVKRPVQRR